MMDASKDQMMFCLKYQVWDDDNNRYATTPKVKKPTVSLGIPENESMEDAERDLDELAKS